ncbi:MAG TPA: pyridoxal-phosphate dependent enzyme [Conexibacter sp.]|nr:pyridoxal-phosphate dependent enzyme [Conexibacter sp.]
MKTEALDLSANAIATARDAIDPAFLDTPQFVAESLSASVNRELIVKVETLNPVGSFKARGASVLARSLDPASTWVCSTAGNFGQGLAYAARERGARIDIFVSPAVADFKVQRMRALGAVVEVSERPEEAARAHAEAREDRHLVVDALDPAMAEGAGSIALELDRIDPLDSIVVQIGDGALAAGIGCWLKSASPQTRVVGVCASGAPAMAESFAAGHAISDPGTGTIATAIAITDPLPPALERVRAFVDEIVLVDDDDIRAAVETIASSLGVVVEPAGAAGLAALVRHGDTIPGDRVAIVLSGSGA